MMLVFQHHSSALRTIMYLSIHRVPFNNESCQHFICSGSDTSDISSKDWFLHVSEWGSRELRTWWLAKHTSLRHLIYSLDHCDLVVHECHVLCLQIRLDMHLDTPELKNIWNGPFLVQLSYIWIKTNTPRIQGIMKSYIRISRVFIPTQPLTFFKCEIREEKHGMTLLLTLPSLSYCTWAHLGPDIQIMASGLLLAANCSWPGFLKSPEDFMSLVQNFWYFTPPTWDTCAIDHRWDLPA